MTIEEIAHNRCSGCSLCSQVCAKKSITMKEDDEGFLYPVVDHTTCVDCGLCLKLCPCNQDPLPEVTPSFYVGSIKDKDLLLRSSSGGFFISLATSFVGMFVDVSSMRK